MAERTTNYDLNTLGAGERLSDDGYKILGADRLLIDRLLQLGAEGHRHSGDATVLAAPTLGPALALGTGGTLPAGVRAHYAYTLIDADGMETAASPAAFIDTPPPVAAPGKPTLVAATTGGTLPPGTYYYLLSAYTSANTSETEAGPAATVSVPVGTSTNAITVTMPALPAGATGWNVYRLKPGGSRFLYLRSVVPPTTSFVDDGSLAEDCDRTEPATNTTLSSNKVTVTIPAPPAGTSAWKLYRTFVAESWGSSLLTTTAGTAILTYQDTGAATVAGAPPDSDQAVASPSKIALTNAAEIDGRAPLGSVSAFPVDQPFEFTGLVVVHQGTGTWVFPYPKGTIKGVRAVLGRGYTPAATPVIVDVNVSPVAANPPAYASIFQLAADRPQVPVGAQWGASVVPTALAELVAGDAMTVDIDQAGGGATPSDYDLTVIVYVWVYGFNLVSHVWAP